MLPGRFLYASTIPVAILVSNALAEKAAGFKYYSARETVRIDASEVVGDIALIKNGFCYANSEESAAAISYNAQDLDLSGAIIRLCINFTHRTIESLDPRIEEFQSRGSIPFVTILGMPQELSSRPEGNGVKKNSHASFPPKDWDAWAEKVRSIVRHYNIEKEYGIKYFGIWNEPNMPSFWLDSTENMLKLYQVTSKAILEIDPSAKIGGMDIAGPVGSLKDSDKPFNLSLIEYCHHNNLPLDFITFHNYRSDPGYLRYNNIIETYRSWLKQYGFENTEIWNTEWRNGLEHRWMPKGEYAMSNHKTSAHFAGNLAEFTDIGLDRQAWFLFGKDSGWTVRRDKENSAMPDLARAGCGYLSYSGVKDPVYHVIEFVNKMGNKRLQTTIENQHFVYALACQSASGADILLSHCPSNVRERVTDFLSRRGLDREKVEGFYMANKNSQVLDKKISPIKSALKTRSLENSQIPENVKEGLKEFFIYEDEIESVQDKPRETQLLVSGLQPGAYEIAVYTVDETHGNAVNAREKINEYLRERFLEIVGDKIGEFGLDAEEQKHLMEEYFTAWTLKYALLKLLEKKGMRDDEKVAAADEFHAAIMREMQNYGGQVNKWPEVDVPSPTRNQITIGEDGHFEATYQLPAFSVKKICISRIDKSAK